MTAEFGWFDPSSTPAGSIFIRNDAPLPPWFRFNYEEYSGWKRLIEANSLALERTAIATGWHFSYIASAVTCSAWALARKSALRRALQKVMGGVSACGYNSFEIAEVTAHRVLLVHTVKVIANPRNLSHGPFLNIADPRLYRSSTKDVEAIFWRAAEGQPEVKGL